MKSVEQPRKLIDVHDEQLNLTPQCRLLRLHRSVHYYKPKGISETDLNLLRMIHVLDQLKQSRGL